MHNRLQRGGVEERVTRSECPAPVDEPLATVSALGSLSLYADYTDQYRIRRPEVDIVIDVGKAHDQMKADPHSCAEPFKHFVNVFGKVAKGTWLAPGRARGRACATANARLSSMQAAVLGIPVDVAEELRSLMDQHPDKLPSFLSRCMLKAANVDTAYASVVLDYAVSRTLDARFYDPGQLRNPTCKKVHVDVYRVRLPGAARASAMCASIAKGIGFMRNMTAEQCKDRFMLFSVGADSDTFVDLLGILPGKTDVAVQNRGKLLRVIRAMKCMEKIPVVDETIGPDQALRFMPLVMLFSFSDEIREIAYDRVLSYIGRWANAVPEVLGSAACNF